VITSSGKWKPANADRWTVGLAALSRRIATACLTRPTTRPPPVQQRPPDRNFLMDRSPEATQVKYLIRDRGSSAAAFEPYSAPRYSECAHASPGARANAIAKRWIAGLLENL
jgi:hypothetical protein